MVAKKGGTANTNWSKTIRNSNTSQSGEVDEHLRQEAFEIDYDLARKRKKAAAALKMKQEGAESRL